MIWLCALLAFSWLQCALAQLSASAQWSLFFRPHEGGFVFKTFIINQTESVPLGPGANLPPTPSSLHSMRPSPAPSMAHAPLTLPTPSVRPSPSPISDDRVIPYPPTTRRVTGFATQTVYSDASCSTIMAVASSALGICEPAKSIIFLGDEAGFFVASVASTAQFAVLSVSNFTDPGCSHLAPATGGTPNPSTKPIPAGFLDACQATGTAAESEPQSMKISLTTSTTPPTVPFLAMGQSFYLSSSCEASTLVRQELTPLPQCMWKGVAIPAKDGSSSRTVGSFTVLCSGSNASPQLLQFSTPDCSGRSVVASPSQAPIQVSLLYAVLASPDCHWSPDMSAYSKSNACFSSQATSTQPTSAPSKAGGAPPPPSPSRSPSKAGGSSTASTGKGGPQSSSSSLSSEALIGIGVAACIITVSLFGALWVYVLPKFLSVPDQAEAAAAATAAAAAGGGGGRKGLAAQDENRATHQARDSIPPPHSAPRASSSRLSFPGSPAPVVPAARLSPTDAAGVYPV